MCCIPLSQLYCFHSGILIFYTFSLERSEVTSCRAYIPSAPVTQCNLSFSFSVIDLYEKNTQHVPGVYFPHYEEVKLLVCDQRTKKLQLP